MKSTRHFFTCLFILLAITIFSQKKQDVVILKIQQNYDLLKMDSYILISYPDETTKTIKLSSAGWRAEDSGETSNASVIQMEINSLTKEGYELLSNDISGDFHLTRTLMTFTKKKE